MDKRSHIRAVDGGDIDHVAQPAEAPATTLAGPVEAQSPQYAAAETEQVWEEPYEDDGPEHARRVLPVVLVLVAAAWTGLFVWSHRSAMLAGASADQWVDWASTWAVPILLVVAVWLLVLRTSTREAARFADIARSLSNESERLEARLATVNRELSLAREFLATQSRELNYFGRAAAEGITRHAEKLDGLLRENSEQFETIDNVSANALSNMEKLRDQLPVIANSSRDVSNQIGNAGRTAQDQLDSMIEGFERLNEFGTASERQVVSLRERIDEALTALSDHSQSLNTSTGARFDQLKSDVEAFRSQLDDMEAANIEATRGRAAALREEIAAADETVREHGDASLSLLHVRLDDLQTALGKATSDINEREAEARDGWANHVADLEERHRLLGEEIARRNGGFASEQAAAIGALSDKLGEIDGEIEARRERHRVQLTELAEESEAVAERIARAGDTFETVSGQAREAKGDLAEAVERLSATLGDSREALDGTDMAIAALTDASVRLLELLQAGSRQTRDDIPQALSASEDRLKNIAERSEQVRSVLDDARSSGEALSQSLDAADARTRETIASVDRFQSDFGDASEAQIEAIEQLRGRIAALDEENRAVAATAQDELRTAIATLEDAARNAFATIGEGQDEHIRQIADRIGERSAAAIDGAVAEHLDDAIASLDLARDRSSEAGRETAEQLHTELARVNELAESLETRVARARSEAQERVDNDFSRRVALITESLNSGSIDVAKALSTDVSDTAWASYLRGDRGIFTRRAVRLIENSEAREIAAIYNDDPDFREHVNRYIHDFESMLRTLLSTRDGNALSVTMLSSDMGKLYVILAQALERLRQ